LLLEAILLVTTAVVLAVVLRAGVAEAFRIPSASMVPQLAVGDRVMVSRLAYRLHEPRRGDIVVFDCPPAAGCARPAPRSLARRGADAVLEAVLLKEPHQEEYIKRVIGLPGETIEGRAGSVWVNGRRLVEPYLPPGTATTDFGPVTVRPDHLWVMGDNRGSSADSRVFGQIRQHTVVGRAHARVWPPWRTAFL
jgi:signal peptidase I